MRYLGAFLISTIIWLSSFPAERVQAQAGTYECYGLPVIEWREARAPGAFAFLYPPEDEAFAQAYSGQFAPVIDAEYARFEALFQSSLTLPITIRLYPTEREYYCLNAQPPELAPGATHSHVGGREIALIRENIAADPDGWLGSYPNAFRYDLGVLFGLQVTGGKALPGLLVAVGHFAQDPAETIGLLQASVSPSLETVRSWRSLWEDTAQSLQFERRIQATSIVAYLVDAYGWQPFLEFLKSLQTTDSYTQALTRVYEKDFSELEKGWQDYFPQYLRSRWQTHVFYNFDLSPYEKMVQEEEFSEAQKGLEGVIPFLEKVDQPEKLNQAGTLLESAKRGQEAEILLLQSRQALQDGEYQRSIVLVDQAETMYALIGNYNHLDLLNAYRNRASTILGLHDQLERLRPQAGTHWNTLVLAARVISLGRQLSALGDIQGHAQALELARVVEARQRSQMDLFSFAVILVILLLLALRILLLRRPPSMEARL